jgi:hypothetical protein
MTDTLSPEALTVLRGCHEILSEAGVELVMDLNLCTHLRAHSPSLTIESRVDGINELVAAGLLERDRRHFGTKSILYYEVLDEAKMDALLFGAAAKKPGLRSRLSSLAGS